MLICFAPFKTRDKLDLFHIVYTRYCCHRRSTKKYNIDFDKNFFFLSLPTLAKCCCNVKVFDVFFFFVLFVSNKYRICTLPVYS